MRFCHIILLLCVLLLGAGCSHTDHCTRLDSVNTLCETDPSQARALLRTINPDSLSTDDRHLYDLLTIRVADKLYITHTSDSLITSVLDYYSSHTDSPHHPQALYYAGRVYSDLGDYPTALSYFQQALDALPEDTDRNGLFKRGFVLSQTARLLHDIRLYNQAIPLIKESLHIDSILNDSLNLMYDHILAGQIHMYEDEFLTAEKHLMNANTIAADLHVEEEGFTNILMAESKLRQQDIASALKYIKKHDIITNNGYKNNAYSTISKIYFYADMPDSAYRYAHFIVSNDSLNDPIGYRMLIASILKKNQISDSIYTLLSKYHTVLEQKQDESENQATILQNTLYNYQRHVRDKLNITKSKIQIERALYVCILFIILLTISVVYFRYRNKLHNLQLEKALNDLRKLKELNNLSDNQPKPSLVAPATTNSLKQELRNELQIIIDNNDSDSKTSASILESEVYLKIQQLLSTDKAIPEHSDLWSEIDDLVLSVAPDFKNKITLLNGSSPKPHDYHLALLIKCGFAPMDMCKLLGKTKGTISSSRKNLGIKLFKESLSTKEVDALIRNL